MIDVWFAKHDGLVWVALVRAGGSPLDADPIGVESVKEAMDYFNSKGTNVNQFGICSPEMLGLE